MVDLSFPCCTLLSKLNITLFFYHQGSCENSLLAMPPRHSNENFLDAYKVVLILDDRETLGFV
jgi:hypothetical protein